MLIAIEITLDCSASTTKSQVYILCSITIPALKEKVQMVFISQQGLPLPKQ